MSHEMHELFREHYENIRLKQKLVDSIPVMRHTLGDLLHGGDHQDKLIGLDNAVTTFFPQLLPKLLDAQREAIGITVRQICALCVNIQATADQVEQNKNVLMEWFTNHTHK